MTVRLAAETHAHVCDNALRWAFDLLGKAWNGVLVATLAEGAVGEGAVGEGAVGFADLRRATGGISDSMLSDRLSERGAAGLVARTVDPARRWRSATASPGAGLALLPVLDDLASWARGHLAP